MDSEDKTSADVREGNPLAPSKSEEPKPSVESGVKSAEGETKASDRPDAKKKAAKEKCSKKHSKGKSRRSKTTTSPPGSSSDSDSDDDTDGTSSSSSSDDNQSEAERSRKKRLAKKHQAPQKAKQKSRDKKHKKASKPHDSSSDSDSDSESESDSSVGKNSGSSDDEETRRFQTELAKQLQLFILQQQQQQQQGGGSYGYPPGLRNNLPPPIPNNTLRHSPPRPRRMGGRPPGRANLTLGGVDPNLLLDGKQPRDKKKRQKATKLDYKRVDQVWDDVIHNYKLQDTAERTVDAQYEEFIFHVRRTFDWEGKYKTTIVDIKSKLLRACLQDVIGDIKGISLVDDTPKLDPNMLFL